MIGSTAEQVAAAIVEPRRTKSPAPVLGIPNGSKNSTAGATNSVNAFRAIVAEGDRRFNYHISALLDRSAAHPAESLSDILSIVRQTLILVATACFAQAQRAPDLEAQRAAMKKLEFLVGKWSGGGRAWRGGDPIEFAQTEEARFKMDGLALLIEGSGDSKAGGKPFLRALAIVSYNDEAGVYRMRAYNDGRYMETELKLAADGKGASWRFTISGFRTSSVLRIDSDGDWTESHDLLIGSGPPRKLMEVHVKRVEEKP